VVLHRVFVVDHWQENRFCVKPFKVPPGAVIVHGSARDLNEIKWTQIPEELIGSRIVPFIYVSGEIAHSLVRASIGEQCVDVKVITLLNYGTTDEATLGKTNNADLLASKVRVLGKVVTALSDLLLHALDD
jgi:hypothetical protein